MRLNFHLDIVLQVNMIFYHMTELIQLGIITFRIYWVAGNHGDNTTPDSSMTAFKVAHSNKPVMFPPRLFVIKVIS